jgi:hypothetical protein
MATVCADPRSLSSDHLAQERRMQRLVRTINGNGWRQRLAPLAEHMGNRRLVRARSDRGAALALLDLDTLQAALMRLLGHDPIQASLIIALAVENAPAAVVAAELSMAHAQLTGELHKAVAALARHYEHIAFAGGWAYRQRSDLPTEERDAVGLQA